MLNRRLHRGMNTRREGTTQNHPKGCLQYLAWTRMLTLGSIMPKSQSESWVEPYFGWPCVTISQNNDGSPWIKLSQLYGERNPFLKKKVENTYMSFDTVVVLTSRWGPLNLISQIQLLNSSLSGKKTGRELGKRKSALEAGPLVQVSIYKQKLYKVSH